MPVERLIHRLRRRYHSLSARVVLSSIVLVLLSAAAIGLPSIWLVQNQIDRQAWSLVNQGAEFARTLYNDQESELINLALITSQRPTLAALVEEGNTDILSDYLEELRIAAELNLLVLCQSDGELVASSGAPVTVNICRPGEFQSIFIYEDRTDRRVDLIASQPLVIDSREKITIIAGRSLNTDILFKIAAQTGLQQTLLIDGSILGTSFDDPSSGNAILIDEAENGSRTTGTTTIGGIPYFSTRVTLLETPGIETIVSLPVTEIAAARGSLTRNIVAGILLVVFVGSLMGVLLSRTIYRPLKQLTLAATRIERGNLTKPVAINTHLREVAQVGYALEDARTALHTTLKELSDEKAWVDHLLESIVEGIITLDKNGRITYFSPGAERITGWRSEEVISRLCDHVFRCVEVGERFSEQLPKPGGQQKIRIWVASGRHTTLAVTGAVLSPPRDGRARIALVLRDVSNEEAIRRLLGDFLANMTHEFRTPLAALAASIELLIDQLPDLSKEELEELLNSTRLGVLGLQTLIDNLLEGASIETGHFRVSPHAANLETIVMETIRVVHPLAQKYHQKLVIDLPDNLPLVIADERRIGQVLLNFISNSVKFNPPEAEIRISVERLSMEIEVSVTDEGPGIPDEERVNLFRRFVHRGNGSERAEAGAGLGLSVVKAIVEAHGGRVGVRDAPGGGSVFWFTLSVADEKNSSLQKIQSDEKKP